MIKNNKKTLNFLFKKKKNLNNKISKKNDYKII
jgi:hypothetical protein